MRQKNYPMNFLSIAQNRYTTKMYNGKRIPEDTLNQLKEILRLSPSSINSQPWQFVFVGDERKNEVFAPLSLINQERVKLASHIVIFRVLDSVARFEQEAPSYISESGFAFYKQYIKSQGDAHVEAGWDTKYMWPWATSSPLVPLWESTLLLWRGSFLPSTTSTSLRTAIAPSLLWLLATATPMTPTNPTVLLKREKQM